MAEAFAAEGLEVSVLGRDAGNLQRVSDSLVGADRAFPIVADITDPASVQSAFAAARGRFGAVHLLVNNAGQAGSAKFTDTDEALWSRLIAVNLTGTYLATRQAVPDMLAEGFGRIVNIARTAGLRGAAYISAYASSKHAVIGLTRSPPLQYPNRTIPLNA